MNSAGPDEELFGIASAVVSIQKLIIVWYVEFSGKQTISQKARATFQKSLCLDLENTTIVSLHCRLSLPVVCGSGIWLENLRSLTTCLRPLIRDLSSFLTEQVCVVLLDSSFVFCGCSLTHTATASCSMWTSDHTHFHIP